MSERLVGANPAVLFAFAVSACSGTSASPSPAAQSAAPSASAASSAGTSASTGTATASWDACKAYSGATLNFIGEATIQTDVLKQLAPDFTDKTGITVNIEEAPYDSVVQKLLLDFT